MRVPQCAHVCTYNGINKSRHLGIWAHCFIHRDARCSLMPRLEASVPTGAMVQRGPIMRARTANTLPMGTAALGSGGGGGSACADESQHLRYLRTDCLALSLRLLSSSYPTRPTPHGTSLLMMCRCRELIGSVDMNCRSCVARCSQRILCVSAVQHRDASVNGMNLITSYRFIAEDLTSVRTSKGCASSVTERSPRKR